MNYPYIIPPEMNIKLVGVIGKAGSGKDTFIDEIRALDHSGHIQKVAFADALKRCCVVAFGLAPKVFYDRELKEQIDPFWSVSPREIAQFVGTELFRNNIDNLLRTKVGKDFWIKRLYQTLIGESEFEFGGFTNQTVFISDVRFQNEVDFITANNGNLVEIIRPSLQGENNVVGIPNHESEKMNLIYPYDSPYTVLNDQGLPELKEQAHRYANILNLV